MPLSVVFVLSVRRYLLKRFTSLQDPVLQRQVIAHICARLSLQSWRTWGVRNLQRVIFKIKCAHRQCLWLHIIYPWETARANTHIHTQLLNTHLTHSDEMYVYACARACVLMGGRQWARGWWSQGGQEGGRECSRTKERRQKKKEKGRRR